MTDKALSYSSPNAVLLPADDADKNTTSRMRRYVRWLDSRSGHWTQPDLAEYKQHLLESGLSERSVSANLSSIRGRYKRLITDNRTRNQLYANTPSEAVTLADKSAWVNEVITQVNNSLNAEDAQVVLVTVQDVTDDRRFWLSKRQAEAIMRAPFDHPDNTPLMALRDAALITLILCTGLREFEAAKLTVSDLRKRVSGELGVDVLGKGNKKRLVPYGAQDWCLVVVDRWLAAAGIEKGPVFRGFYPYGQRVRETAITTRAVQDIIHKYTVLHEGELISVAPHDLRRTYARQLYESGMKLLYIQQNMGHADSKTTERYIGDANMKQRAPDDMYHFDLKLLDRV